MKKILVLVCLLITSYCNARDFKFGVKTGLNLSSAIGSDIHDSAKMRLGMYLGGFVNTPLNDRFSLQSELTYSMQGWKVGNQEDDRAIYKTHYLNMPLLLRMNLGHSDKIHVYAGPQVGVLLNARSEYYTQFGEGTTSITEWIKNFDFSITLGVSIAIYKKIDLDLRYNRGLTQVVDLYFLDGTSYYSIIQLGASYSF